MSFTCLLDLNAIALFAESARSISWIIKAAAPSDTIEQSVLLKGSATYGFFSDTELQNSKSSFFCICANGFAHPFS